MLGQNVVSVGLERGSESPQPRDRAAIASDGTREIDFQARTPKSLTPKAYFAAATPGTSGVFFAARRPFSQSCIISM
jgi:hypothetical protein